MLHGLYISLPSCVDSHLALLRLLLRDFLLLSSLNHNGRQEGNQASSLSLKRGLFFTEQCLNTITDAVRISAITRSLPEVSSSCLHSPVFEQGGTSERIPVVDLSSDEEDLIPDISRDDEFAKRLFDDLNHELLGPPSDGKVIVLSDFDEE
jgi:hypothetical protein